MIMQRDVVSLGMAKRLKEAGWNQGQHAWWYSEAKNWELQNVYQNHTCRFHPTDWFHQVGCPHTTLVAAPTIGDLLGVLPPVIFITKSEKGYTVAWPTCLCDGDRDMDDWTFESENLADCLVALWIALKEKGLV